MVLAFVLTLTLSAASLAVRFRRARGQERQQLKWLAAVSIPVLGFFVAVVFGPTWQNRLLDAVVIALLFSAMYAAIGIAVLRHRLYDIDLLLTRTLAYGLLTAAFTVVYLVIVVGIGSLVGSRGRPNLLSIAATAVIAVAFQPARDRSRRLANRLVYGSRATPYEVLSAFSRGVTGASTDDSLQRMARLVVEATGASGGDRVAAARRRPAAAGPLAPGWAVARADRAPGPRRAGGPGRDAEPPGGRFRSDTRRSCSAR